MARNDRVFVSFAIEGMCRKEILVAPLGDE